MKIVQYLDAIGLIGLVVTFIVWYLFLSHSYWPLLLAGVFLLLLVGGGGGSEEGAEAKGQVSKVDQDVPFRR